MDNMGIRKENFKLFELVQQAVSLLDKNDKDLLERNLHENSIAFRIGHYLQCLVLSGDYGINRGKVVVDAEYNRNGYEGKGVFVRCKNCCNKNNECYIKSDKTIYCNLKGNNNTFRATLQEFTKTGIIKHMIPDLLIHERMPMGNMCNEEYNNYVAIEIKKKYGNRIVRKALDFAKLTYLTCRAGEYKYKLGLYLDFSEHKCLYKAFEDGKAVSEGTL